MKKVLIITYYWPPAAGAGVQRWLKFTKYLRDFGWEPVIYTSEINEHFELDYSFIKDIPENITVIRRPVWEPYNLYKWFIGKKKSEKINVGFLSETKKPKLSEKISVWIRSNFFIPDAHCFWIKPSVRFLYKYLIEHSVDAIVSTGPPHTTHLIALNLVNKFNSKFTIQNSEFRIPKWLADFRDPWTYIDFYKDLKLTSWADKKHHKLELAVLKNVDACVVVGKTMAEEFSSIFKRKYFVITNGYDNEDIINLITELDSKFSIAHIGSLTKSRNPDTLWKVLSELVDESLSDKDNELKSFHELLEIKLVGKLDLSVLESLKKYKLDTYLNKIEYLPHDEVLKIQKESQILLLLINRTENAKGILTGKLFEYLAAHRPIFCIGPKDGDVSEIIINTNSGIVVDFDDNLNLKNTIINFYKLFSTKKLFSTASGIEKYSRKELTRNLVDVLNLITYDER